MAFEPEHLNEIDMRFRAVYAALASERGSADDDQWLRFAAFAVILTPGSPASIAQAIRARSVALRSQAPWYDALSSPMRFMVAAVLLQSHGRVATFTDTLERTKAAFDHIGLRHRAGYDVVSAAIIHLMNHGRPLGALQLEHVKNLYDRMKTLHWWLTGPEDTPVAVLLSFRLERTEVTVTQAESIYRSLIDQDYRPGNALKTAAHILVFDNASNQAAERFDALCGACIASGLPMATAHYEALAVLTLLNHPAQAIARRVRSYLESLKDLRPALDGPGTVALACDLTFFHLVRLGRDDLPLSDLDEVGQMLRSLRLVQSMSLITAMDCATAPLDAAQAVELWPYSGS